MIIALNNNLTYIKHNQKMNIKFRIRIITIHAGI